MIVEVPAAILPGRMRPFASRLGPIDLEWTSTEREPPDEHTRYSDVRHLRQCYTGLHAATRRYHLSLALKGLLVFLFLIGLSVVGIGCYNFFITFRGFG
jgi:hypothetical protein